MSSEEALGWWGGVGVVSVFSKTEMKQNLKSSLFDELMSHCLKLGIHFNKLVISFRVRSSTNREFFCHYPPPPRFF